MGSVCLQLLYMTSSMSGYQGVGGRPSHTSEGRDVDDRAVGLVLGWHSITHPSTTAALRGAGLHIVHVGPPCSLDALAAACVICAARTRMYVDEQCIVLLPLTRTEWHTRFDLGGFFLSILQTFQHAPLGEGNSPGESDYFVFSDDQLVVTPPGIPCVGTTWINGPGLDQHSSTPMQRSPDSLTHCLLTRDGRPPLLYGALVSVAILKWVATAEWRQTFQYDQAWLHGESAGDGLLRRFPGLATLALGGLLVATHNMACMTTADDMARRYIAPYVTAKTFAGIQQLGDTLCLKAMRVRLPTQSLAMDAQMVPGSPVWMAILPISLTKSSWDLLQRTACTFLASHPTRRFIMVVLPPRQAYPVTGGLPGRPQGGVSSKEGMYVSVAVATQTAPDLDVFTHWSETYTASALADRTVDVLTVSRTPVYVHVVLVMDPPARVTDSCSVDGLVGVEFVRSFSSSLGGPDTDTKEDETTTVTGPCWTTTPSDSLHLPNIPSPVARIRSASREYIPAWMATAPSPVVSPRVPMIRTIDSSV